MIELLIKFFFTFLVSLVGYIGTALSAVIAWILKSAWISPIAGWATRRMMASPTTKPMIMSIKNGILYIKHGWKHPQFPMTREILVMVVFLMGLAIWSGYEPVDRMIWLINLVPVTIEFVFLAAFFYRHPFTQLLYNLLFFQIAVTIIGAHYTYAYVPMGNFWMNVFHLERNYFDRAALFLQGFVIAIFIREILIQKTALKNERWLLVICSGLTLAIMTVYQTIQWMVLRAISNAQQQVWRSQMDLWIVFLGALVALVSLWKYHNKQLAKLHAKMHQ